MSAVCHEHRSSALLNVQYVDDELYGHERLPGAHSLSPINAFAQHRKLCARQRHGPACCLRPYKLAAVETLHQKTHAFAVMPKDLNRITSAPAEDEDLS